MKKFHISRWRYWLGYLVVFMLVIATIWFNDRAADVAAWIMGLLGLVLLVVLEIMIRIDTLIVKDDALEHRIGILSRNVTRITYNSISNVSTNQTLFQRIFGFGDVYIDTPGQTPGREFEIVLKGFARPNKIEQLVGTYIHKVHEAHPHHATKPHVGK